MSKCVAMLLALSLALPASAQDAPHHKQRVTFKSADLTLTGFLFKPDGAGPFPTLIWNHGSEKDPASKPQFDEVANVFVPAGYVVFAPVRRGHSDSQGPYIQDQLRDAADDAQRLQLQVQLLDQQLDDQLAGLAYARALPFVDPKRLAVAGCSYGGIQTLLAAERGAGYRAAVAISPAALSWPHNPLIRERLIKAARGAKVPVFLIQPPKDASLEPSRVLGAEFRKQKKPFTGTIYPETIPQELQGHCFGGIHKGSGVWAPDVLEFLAKQLS
jgi:carboxymethylenebutenolidase